MQVQQGGVGADLGEGIEAGDSAFVGRLARPAADQGGTEHGHGIVVTDECLQGKDPALRRRISGVAPLLEHCPRPLRQRGASSSPITCSIPAYTTSG